MFPVFPTTRSHGQGRRHRSWPPLKLCIRASWSGCISDPSPRSRACRPLVATGVLASIFVSATLGLDAPHGNDHRHLMSSEVCLQTRQDTRIVSKQMAHCSPSTPFCASLPPLHARKVVADCGNHAESRVRRHHHEREEYCTQQSRSRGDPLIRR